VNDVAQPSTANGPKSLLRLHLHTQEQSTAFSEFYQQQCSACHAMLKPHILQCSIACLAVKFWCATPWQQAISETAAAQDGAQQMLSACRTTVTLPCCYA
jgi:hypothetical protein